MEMPLLQTKLYIPPPRPTSSVVPRPRLIERLNEGLLRKLTFISAPAGFGKTTLVSSWLNNLRFTNDDLRLDAAKESQIVNRKSKIVNQVAWLSLDDADNDPVRFLTYVVAALQTIEANIGKGTLRALQAPQPPPTEAVLTAVINDVAALPNQIILVLDDYHLIEVPLIHDALTFLLEHMPPQLHLVIATREDPPLPLARLRVRGQLTELRATDLRFTASEAAAFLNQAMGLNLSAEDIATLETRTEGWIAGLQLAAISMQGREDASRFIKLFSGSHRYVLDYLVEEVLEQQPESIQTFLLQTSVLDRLCGPLCDAVAGRLEIEDWRLESDDQAADNLQLPISPQSAQSQETLEHLEHANLFIVPLDEERRWYRYHHLFADLLRQRLHQTQPEQVSILHHRASDWFEQEGFTDEAIEYALRAGDFQRAAYLIEELAEAVWGRGEHTKLWGWLKALPADQVSARPRLCIFRAWVLFINGQQQAAELSLQAAEQALRSTSTDIIGSSPGGAGRLPDLNKVTLQGRVAAIRRPGSNLMPANRRRGRLLCGRLLARSPLLFQRVFLALPRHQSTFQGCVRRFCQQRSSNPRCLRRPNWHTPGFV